MIALAIQDLAYTLDTEGTQGWVHTTP